MEGFRLSFLLTNSSCQIFSTSTFLFLIQFSLCLCLSQFCSIFFLQIGSIITERLFIILFSILNYYNQHKSQTKINISFYFVSQSIFVIFCILFVVPNIIISPMRVHNNKCKNRCGQVTLMAMFLITIVTFYAFIASVMGLGEALRNIDRMQIQKIDDIGCQQICESGHNQQYLSSQCCQNAEARVNCLSKLECLSKYIEKQQKVKSNQIVGAIIQGVIMICCIIILTVYCIKKRKQIKQRSIPQIQRPIQTNYFQSINTINFGQRLRQLQQKQQHHPAQLNQSFLCNDNISSCPICLQVLMNERVIELKCQHTFHSCCIRSWMQTRYTCPLCRTAH